MLRFLNSLKDENGRVRIEGFYDDVLPVIDTEKEGLAQIPFMDLDMFIKGIKCSATVFHALAGV